MNIYLRFIGNFCVIIFFELSILYILEVPVECQRTTLLIRMGISNLVFQYGNFALGIVFCSRVILLWEFLIWFFNRVILFWEFLLWFFKRVVLLWEFLIWFCSRLILLWAFLIWFFENVILLFCYGNRVIWFLRVKRKTNWKQKK